MTQHCLMIKLSSDLDYYKNRSLRRQGPTTPSTLLTTPITKLTSIAASKLPAPLSHLNALLNTEDSSICCPVASALRSDINTAQSLTAANDGIHFTSALICICNDTIRKRDAKWHDMDRFMSTCKEGADWLEAFAFKQNAVSTDAEGVKVLICICPVLYLD